MYFREKLSFDEIARHTSLRTTADASAEKEHLRQVQTLLMQLIRQQLKPRAEAMEPR